MFFQKVLFLYYQRLRNKMILHPAIFSPIFERLCTMKRDFKPVEFDGFVTIFATWEKWFLKVKWNRDRLSRFEKCVKVSNHFRDITKML